MKQKKLLSRISVPAAALALMVSAVPLPAQVGTQGETGKAGPAIQGGVRENPGAGETPSSSAGMATSSDDIRKLQQALKDKGLDPGPINGVIGPKTQEAVRAFQQRQGLNATGRLDAQTQGALGIGIGQPGSSRSGAQSPGSGGASAGTSVEPAVPRDPSVKPGEPLPPANQSPGAGAGSVGGAGGR